MQSFLLLFTVLITSPYEVVSQAPGSPCNAQRWEKGGHWTGSGCAVNDANNAPDPLGIIRCGNSADTESNIQNNTTYLPSVFTIVPTMCTDPNTNLPVVVNAPFEGQDITWFNFDVRPNAGIYDFQTIATGNYELEWALYYSTQETCSIGSNGLSGECATLSEVIACGTDFNGWSPQPYLTPIFPLATNLYLVVWKKGATDTINDDFNFTFKARYGCGDFCSLKIEENPVVTCNPDGSYEVVQQVMGTSTTITVTAPGSSSIVSDPTPLTFTTADEVPNINSGYVTVTYPAGVNYTITFTPSGEGAYCLPLSISGAAPNCCITPLCSIDGLADVCPGTVVEHCGPDGQSGYAWVVSGNGVIIGASNEQCVSVQASSVCDANYTLTLTTGMGSCSSICSTVVSITDTNLPVIVCPTVISPVACGTALSFGIAVASDACDTSVEITYSDITTEGDCSSSYSVTRTWVATDDCGNTATCSSTIVVQDIVAPVIVCPTVISPIECGTEVYFGTATATDACDVAVEVSYVDVTVEGLCAQEYSVTRTWTATDDCGNIATCSATIQVQDNTAPVITGPIVESPISCETEISFGIATALDACDASVEVSYLDVTVEGLCAQEYSVTRTWTATDNCGNSATYSATIVVQDNTAPVITGPVVESPISCDNEISFGIATALDACDASVEVIYSDVTVEGLCAQEYSVTRTWTATDNCGNSATYSATIVVEDNTAPVIVCPVVESPIECGTEVYFGTATATDECDDAVEISYSDVTVEGSCAQEYSVTRTWTATDECGNFATCSATIQVEDTTAPIIECPAPQSPIECGTEISFGDPITLDACDASVEVSYSDVTVEGSCAQEYSVIRTWIATDDCGNSATHSDTIVVQDNTAPVIVCPVVESPIECGSEVSFGTATATDACDASVEVNYSDVTVEGSCAQEYSVTRTWTATDNCGNSATCSATIQVQDNTAPIIVCPIVESPIPCGEIPLFGDATASDLCDTAVEIVFSDVTIEGLCEESNSITRTWIATDDCGNSASCSATIIVEQNQSLEVFNCPSDTLVACDSEVPAIDPSLVEASGNCGTITVTHLSDVISDQTCLNSYTLTRTYQGTDACGNVTTCSQIITVRDLIEPVIICPEVVSPIYCPALPVFPLPTVWDNCDTSVTLTYTEETIPGPWQQEYSVVRIWTATDDCGNTATCSSTINILDSTPPVITCPTVISPIECGSEVLFGIAVAIDACDTAVMVTFSDVTVQGDCPQSYSVTRTWTAMDNAMNTSTCSRTIVVQDITPPVIVCPVVVSPIPCGETPLFGDATASDLCDTAVDVVFYDVTIEGLCQETNSVTRTWIATDDCGNSATCSATIIVEVNQELLTITCLPDTLVECADDVPPVDISLIEVSGDCETITVTHLGDVITDQTCSNNYTLVRTYQAVGCGVILTCSQNITVRDVVAPVITCPTVNSPVECGTTISFGVATATDACDAALDVSFTDVTVQGSCAQEYSVTRTWTATDDCGNSASCSRTIVVQDNTLPVIVCPVVVSPIPCGAVPSFGTATVTDACDPSLVISFTDVTIAGLCPQEYTVTRTWVATDDCGNVASCSATIVVGNTATELAITCPGDITVQCEDELPGIDISLVTYSGNCGTVTVTHLSDVITNQTCLNNYTLVRTYQATDACGDVATCSQNIIVSDTTAPVITFQLPITQQSGDTLLTQCYGQDPEWDIPTYGPENIIVSGVCTDDYTITYDISLEDEGDCALEGYINLYRLEWTVTDSCGNSSNAHLFLALVDSIPPVIEGVPADITVTCENIPAPPSLFATDECLCACLVYMEETEIDPSACQNGQVMIRTWTATDRCGNETIETQRITLIDEEAPVLTIVHPEMTTYVDGMMLEYTCSEGGIPAFYALLDSSAVVITGLCDSSSTISFRASSTLQTNCDFFGYIEEREYRWTAIDPCGYSTELSIRVRLIDNEAPVILGLPEIVCIGDPILDEIEVYDNCDPRVTLSYWDVNIPNPCGEGTARRRTYEAYDHCGNVAMDTVILLPPTQNVPVLLFLNPAMELIDSSLVTSMDCDATGDRFTTFGIEDVIVEGVCAEGATITFTETLLYTTDCNPGESMATVELRWRATDACGAFTERIIIAQITDETGPVFVNLRPEVWVGCNDSLPEIFATDNCGDVFITSIDSIYPGSCAYEYDVIRHITLRDHCGNTTYGRQTVHVGNENGPVITGVQVYVCDDLSIPEVTAYDECADQFVAVSMVQDTLESECRDGLVIQRTWSATDACGNINEIRQTIIMNDHTAPEILFPSNSVLHYFTEHDNTTVYHSQVVLLDRLNDIDEDDVYVFDDCDQLIIPVFNVDTLQGENCLTQRIYTWIATDICENADTLSFTVSIIDDVAPEFVDVTPDSLIYCAPLPPPATMLMEDSLEIVTIVYTELQEVGPIPGQIIVIRRWVATDLCDNTTTYVQRIIWNQASDMECAIIIPEVVNCNSHGVLITSEILGGVGPYTYEWVVVGEKCFIQSGQGTPEILIYVGWSDVNIILTVTDSFGCITTCMVTLDCHDINALLIPGSWEDNAPVTMEEQSIFHTPIVNANGEQDLESLSFYPNPADDVIHIVFESAIDGFVDFSFTDYLGKVILREKMKVNIGQNAQQIDASNFANGSYLIQIQSEKTHYARGIIILHE